MRRILLTAIVALTLTGCELWPDQRRVTGEAPPPATVLAPGQDVPLEEKLRMVEAEIELALAGEPERILTAEAITDQLLHAPREVDWLATGYLVEARLRQIQALADAVVAKLRRGATLAAVEDDLVTIRTAIQDLQAQLALPGGGPAPPPLEQLLAQDPLRDARVRVDAAAQTTPTPDATAPQPLGQPADPTPDP